MFYRSAKQQRTQSNPEQTNVGRKKEEEEQEEEWERTHYILLLVVVVISPHRSVFVNRSLFSSLFVDAVVCCIVGDCGRRLFCSVCSVCSCVCVC